VSDIGALLPCLLAGLSYRTGTSCPFTRKVLETDSMESLKRYPEECVFWMFECFLDYSPAILGLASQLYFSTSHEIAVSRVERRHRVSYLEVKRGEVPLNEAETNFTWNTNLSS
jgi:hypothetical protein